ncbi:MAG: hypothetical protein WBA85_19245 [Brucella anthropi]
MTRPLLKELPRGSRIEYYVNRMCTDAQGWEKTWPWQNPGLVEWGTTGLCSQEPRIWKWPRVQVRDRLVLPAIARIEGEEAAALFQKFLPNILDDFVDFYCEREYRDATALQRKATPEDMSGLVFAVVIGILHGHYDVTKSENANYVRTAERLNIRRDAVRRIDRRFRRNFPINVAARLVVFMHDILTGYDLDGRPRRSRSS